MRRPPRDNKLVSSYLGGKANKPGAVVPKCQTPKGHLESQLKLQEAIPSTHTSNLDSIPLDPYF